MKIIKTLSQLKRLSTATPLECAIMLQGELVSRKRIQFMNNEFHVENYIDGSKQWLDEKQIFDSSLTNIGEALKNGSLIILSDEKTFIVSVDSRSGLKTVQAQIEQALNEEVKAGYFRSCTVEVYPPKNLNRPKIIEQTK